MRFDFLTPEIFDLLVYANLTVAVLLIAFRFYQDMTHIDNRDKQRREMVHDETSRLSDSEIESILYDQEADTNHQTSQNQ